MFSRIMPCNYMLIYRIDSLGNKLLESGSELVQILLARNSKTAKLISGISKSTQSKMRNVNLPIPLSPILLSFPKGTILNSLVWKIPGVFICNYTLRNIYIHMYHFGGFHEIILHVCNLFFSNIKSLLQYIKLYLILFNTPKYEHLILASL